MKAAILALVTLLSSTALAESKLLNDIMNECSKGEIFDRVHVADGMIQTSTGVTYKLTSSEMVQYKIQREITDPVSDLTAEKDMLERGNRFSARAKVERTKKTQLPCINKHLNSAFGNKTVGSTLDSADYIAMRESVHRKTTEFNDRLVKVAKSQKCRGSSIEMRRMCVTDYLSANLGEALVLQNLKDQIGYLEMAKRITTNGEYKHLKRMTSMTLNESIEFQDYLAELDDEDALKNWEHLTREGRFNMPKVLAGEKETAR